MPRVTISIGEISEFSESGESKHEIKDGICVREFNIQESCRRKGIEISAPVDTMEKCIELFDQLFEIASTKDKV